MKHSFCGAVPFFFLLLISLTAFSLTSARFFHPKTGEKMVEVDEPIDSSTDRSHLFYLQTIDSFNEVMGMEKCGNEDEECLKRRVLAEAHLDYIYTQHHKP